MHVTKLDMVLIAAIILGMIACISTISGAVNDPPVIEQNTGNLDMRNHEIKNVSKINNYSIESILGDSNSLVVDDCHAITIPIGVRCVDHNEFNTLYVCPSDGAECINGAGLEKERIFTNIYYADDYAVGSTTGGIAEAMAAAPTNDAIIVLSPGTYSLTTALSLGDTAAVRTGLIIVGAGRGGQDGIGASLCNTVLRWDGSVGLTAVTIKSLQSSYVGGFCIDGLGISGRAATALAITSDTSTPVRGLTVEVDAWDASAEQLRVGTTADKPIEDSVIVGSFTGGVSCTRNISGGTRNVSYNIYCYDPILYGLVLEDGNAIIDNSTIVFPDTGNSPIAAVQIQNSFDDLFINNLFMDLYDSSGTPSGHCIQTLGNTRTALTKIQGICKLNGDATDRYFLNYVHAGALDLTNYVVQVGSGLGKLKIDLSAHAGSLNLLMNNINRTLIDWSEFVEAKVSQTTRGVLCVEEPAASGAGTSHCISSDTTGLFFDTDKDGVKDGGEDYVGSGSGFDFDGAMDTKLAPCDNGAPLVNSAGTTVCGVTQVRDLSSSEWSGVLDYARLPDAAVAGMPLVSGGAGDPTYGAPRMQTMMLFRDEFFNGTVGSSSGPYFNGWQQAVSGSGGTFNVLATNKIGVGGIRATSAGYTIERLMWGGTTSGFHYLQGGEVIEARFGLMNGLGTDGGGNEYDIVFGLCDTGDATTINCTDGTFFLYDVDDSTGYPLASNGNWWVVSENGGVVDSNSVKDTGVAAVSMADANAAMMRFKIAVSNDKGTITFSLDGNDDGDYTDGAGVDYTVNVTTNIPAGSTQPIIAINKIDGSSNRYIYIDWYQFYKTYAGGR